LSESTPSTADINQRNNLETSIMTEVDIDELLENLAQCRWCGICRNTVYEDRALVFALYGKTLQDQKFLKQLNPR
jgi:hypothetical protein